MATLFMGKRQAGRLTHTLEKDGTTMQSHSNGTLGVGREGQTWVDMKYQDFVIALFKLELCFLITSPMTSHIR